MSEKYTAIYYRNSQYSDIETAIKNGAVYLWEVTYGYSATVDAFINAVSMLKCFDSSALSEFRFVWTIDGVKFPETDHVGSFDLLHASYNYFANSNIESAKEVLSK
jgi:hypothetical protein